MLQNNSLSNTATIFYVPGDFKTSCNNSCSTRPEKSKIDEKVMDFKILLTLCVLLLHFYLLPYIVNVHKRTIDVSIGVINGIKYSIVKDTKR